MHPLIEEFQRVSSVQQLQPTYFRRVQRELRDVIQPLLDERDALIARVAVLEQELAKATKPRRRDEVPA